MHRKRNRVDTDHPHLQLGGPKRQGVRKAVMRTGAHRDLMGLVIFVIQLL